MATVKEINPDIKRSVGPDLYAPEDEFDDDFDAEYTREIRLMGEIRNYYKNPSSAINLMTQIINEQIDLLALKKVYNIFDGIGMIEDEENFDKDCFRSAKKLATGELTNMDRLNDFFNNESYFMEFRKLIGEFLKICNEDIHEFDHSMLQKMKGILKFLEENTVLQPLNLMSEVFIRKFAIGKNQRGQATQFAE
jgi:hypothetical protein